MTEYEAKVKDVADYIRNLRLTSGNMTSAMTFALISTLLAKRKLSENDVDTIFDVERGQSETTLKSYFNANMADPNFELKNEQEMEDVLKILNGGVEDMKKLVKQIATQIQTKRQKKKAAAGGPADSGEDEDEDEE